MNDATESVTGGTTSDGGGGSGSSLLDSATDSITGALSGSSDSGAGGTSSSGGSGSNSTSSRSSSSSGDGSASNRGSPRTRFDRLPRQYERLLERIESGVDVRASSARLRALLATASPSLRTQILRLIRQEIRRLRRGGLTHRERAAVRRLTPLLKALEASRPPAEISLPSGAASLPATSSDGRSQIAGISDASVHTGRPAESGPSGPELAPLFPWPLPSPSGPDLLAARPPSWDRRISLACGPCPAERPSERGARIRGRPWSRVVGTRRADRHRRRCLGRPDSAALPLTWRTAADGPRCKECPASAKTETGWSRAEWTIRMRFGRRRKDREAADTTQHAVALRVCGWVISQRSDDPNRDRSNIVGRIRVHQLDSAMNALFVTRRSL